jgi:predicted N-acetyltransferase YhbS
LHDQGISDDRADADASMPRLAAPVPCGIRSFAMSSLLAPSNAPINVPPVIVSAVTAADLPAIFNLNERVFGPGRFARTAYRIREGLPLISRFCLKATEGRKLLAAIRFTEVTIGGQPGGLLLGPLAVETGYAGLGYGKRLIADGMANAKAAGIGLCVLIGNEPYYGRFGFVVLAPGQIELPGPADPGRILGAELSPGALGQYRGLVRGIASPTVHTAASVA